MTPDSIRKLYGYHYWAFERVWQQVLQLTDEQFCHSVDYSMGSVRNQMVHLMSGTRRWLYRVQDAPIPPHLPFEDFSTLEAAKATWDAMKVEMLHYIYSLDQAQLDKLVHWEIPTRNIKCANPLWELLLHVANHATDHRAQILAMLHFHFGVETVEQDMVFYLLETVNK